MTQLKHKLEVPLGRDGALRRPRRRAKRQATEPTTQNASAYPNNIQFEFMVRQFYF